MRKKLIYKSVNRRINRFARRDEYVTAVKKRASGVAGARAKVYINEWERGSWSAMFSLWRNALFSCDEDDLGVSVGKYARMDGLDDLGDNKERYVGVFVFFSLLLFVFVFVDSDH